MFATSICELSSINLAEDCKFARASFPVSSIIAIQRALQFHSSLRTRVNVNVGSFLAYAAIWSSTAWRINIHSWDDAEGQHSYTHTRRHRRWRDGKISSTISNATTTTTHTHRHNLTLRCLSIVYHPHNLGYNTPTDPDRLICLTAANKESLKSQTIN